MSTPNGPIDIVLSMSAAELAPFAERSRRSSRTNAGK
jgi:hypothetical protein